MNETNINSLTVELATNLAGERTRDKMGEGSIWTDETGCLFTYTPEAQEMFDELYDFYYNEIVAVFGEGE